MDPSGEMTASHFQTFPLNNSTLKLSPFVADSSGRSSSPWAMADGVHSRDIAVALGGHFPFFLSISSIIIDGSA
jgi:hypothetical protein